MCQCVNVRERGGCKADRLCAVARSHREYSWENMDGWMDGVGGKVCLWLSLWRERRTVTRVSHRGQKLCCFIFAKQRGMSTTFLQIFLEHFSWQFSILGHHLAASSLCLKVLVKLDAFKGFCAVPPSLVG